jgi:HipA-like protein
MRKAILYNNKIEAGIVTEVSRTKYIFRYNDLYFNDLSKPAISLTIPKKHQEYESEFLFAFLYNMLSEGVNKKLQSLQLRIDEEDSFGLLLATAQYDTIGALTLKPLSE